MRALTMHTFTKPSDRRMLIAALIFFIVSMVTATIWQ